MRWLIVLVLASAAVAGPNDAVLRTARSLAEEGNVAGAALVVGKALKSAQGKGNLVREVELWKGCRRLFSRKDRRTAMFELMKSLQRSRGGASVTAPLLAERLLYECIAAGDKTHLEELTVVLRKHAMKKGSGRHMALVSRLALVLGGKNENPAAICAEAAKQGWPELAGMASVVALGEPEHAGRDAKAVVDSVVEAMLALKDRGLAQQWRSVVHARLAKNEAAMDAVQRVFAAMPNSVSATGGAPGGAGGDAGRVNESSLGRAWPRFSKRKALASVRCGKRLVVSHGFEKYEKEFKIRTGIKHVNHGGLTLAFNRTGVRPVMFDMRGLEGQPGDSSEAGLFDLFHRLAPGETWELTKSGVRIK